ncbi:phosphopentomutase [Desulfovibrio sp. OttesenSCG-928-G15]|nr:phosphopentomutase [Desulfovibrio sp. OttesenSCG-928-G15]
MRSIVIVLDSLGIGLAPDAALFGDSGADTLGHIAAACLQGRADSGSRSGPLRVPNLERMGLGLAWSLLHGRVPAGFSPAPELCALYGAASERSSGKDTVSGHWELAGVPVSFDWGYFPDQEHSFPDDLLDRIQHRAGLGGFHGNCHASGTQIIARHGEEHMRSGWPIVYTSADSVFQVACHEERFGLERLYDLCSVIREEVDPYSVCRVIARPFIGSDASSFVRTGNRRDYAVAPVAETLLQKLVARGGTVTGIGKIADIYAGCGITRPIKAVGMDALWDATLEQVGNRSDTPLGGKTDEGPDSSLIMVNFVDFDQNFGHRRDVAGYALALEQFDARLPELFARMRKDDVLCIAADHGCDPTFAGSDHTRECIPLLVQSSCGKTGSIGIRNTFADLGQTLADLHGLPLFAQGTSFADALL